MILTVCSGRDQANWFDIELSLETKAIDLIRELQSESGLSGILDDEKVGCILEGRHPDGTWFRVQGDCEIGLSGLTDGDYVRIQRTYGTVDMEP
ncbi:hypothetical protein [Paenibacillus tuaregi]|uniref:hypothetical protein n=1 Tax=Paenibacillus tuaregi TaxID=1816681 RepID=UPI000837F6C2|nr:hypothetical protein [Paenibacillus tuaregi]